MTLKTQKPQFESNNQHPKNLLTIGNHIRKRRLELMLTAKEVGKILGVDMSTIYKWEYNIERPNPRCLSWINEFLGYEPDIPKRQFYGEIILTYRKLHGISQAKLAKMLDINKTTLRQWEKNLMCPSEGSLEKLRFLVRDDNSEKK